MLWVLGAGGKRQGAGGEGGPIPDGGGAATPPCQSRAPLPKVPGRERMCVVATRLAERLVDTVRRHIQGEFKAGHGVYYNRVEG